MHQVMRRISHQWRVEDQRELVGINEDVIDDRGGSTTDFEARDLIDRMRLSLPAVPGTGRRHFSDIIELDSISAWHLNLRSRIES